MGLLNFNVSQVYYIQRGDNKLNRKDRNANGYLLSSGKNTECMLFCHHFQIFILFGFVWRSREKSIE